MPMISLCQHLPNFSLSLPFPLGWGARQYLLDLNPEISSTWGFPDGPFKFPVSTSVWSHAPLHQEMNGFPLSGGIRRRRKDNFQHPLQSESGAEGAGAAIFANLLTFWNQPSSLVKPPVSHKLNDGNSHLTPSCVWRLIVWKHLHNHDEI